MCTSNPPGQSSSSRWATAVAPARCPPPVSAMRKRRGMATWVAAYSSTGRRRSRGEVERLRLEAAHREARHGHLAGPVGVRDVRLLDTERVDGEADQPPPIL